MRPRIVRNMLPGSYCPIPAAGINTNGTSTALPDGWRKIESTASAFRVFWQWTVAGCEAGKRYAFRVAVRNISAAVAGRMWYKFGETGEFSAAGTWADNAGSNSAIMGCVYNCTTSGTIILRFGVGLDAGVGTHPWSMEIGDPLFAEIPATQSAPPEYIFAGLSAVINKAFAGTNVGGFVVDGVGSDVSVEQQDAILVLGDSFCNDSTDWPQVVAPTLTQKSLYQNAVAGRSMLTAIDTVPSQIALSALNVSGVKTYPAFPSYASRPGLAVIALGVNDIANSATVQDMRDRFESMSAALFTGGASKIIAFDIPPWKNSTTWTAPKEVVRADYNAWIITRVASDARMKLFKISDILKDGTDPALLAAAYDSGDHIHPNATGSAAIAAAVEPYLMWGWGKWTPFASMPPLSLASTAPGKLLEVQEWSKVASKTEIDRV